MRLRSRKTHVPMAAYLELNEKDPEFRYELILEPFEVMAVRRELEEAANEESA